MKLFTDLYVRLDQTNKTNEKVEAMRSYFGEAAPHDAAWALYFLSGRKPRQIVPSKFLREWSLDLSGIPEWLYLESRDTVGDGAETMALLLPNTDAIDETALNTLVEEQLLPLRGLDEEMQKAAVTEAWARMNYSQRLVYNKLITGAFRVGVSQLLVIRALSQLSELPTDVIAMRLMGDWSPSEAFFRDLLDPELDPDETPIARPFPFHLAHQLDFPADDLGNVGDWQAEWKWDGIRAQVIKRAGEVFIWSRGEDLMTERFPEIESAARELTNGTVLDGELLPWREGRVLPFSEMQRRIGRKNLSAKILEEVPIILQCYDLLEYEGRDIRSFEMKTRRGLLEDVLAGLSPDAARIFRPTETVKARSWSQLAEKRETSRSLGVEGFMLKHRDSPYRVGRHRGDWWKWKVDPLTVDAVLIYAQKGSGKRSNLFTDYTFAVWKGDELVPFAKAYSGLTDAEIRKVDRYVRDNTLETFGPVRAVKPQLVFELGFEGMQRSSRHKSGVAVRFPRILRWREDKRIEEADSLETINEMLEAFQGETKK
ncbi:MAG TPA: ATP-dependent DNA ligase [Pyrinomonadaceae bacterium]|nr:ATP-dependent DNA ligase [Pyrinomonadaceae bacterium]